MRTPSRLILSAVLLGSPLATLGGCQSLPRSGPYKSDMLAPSGTPNTVAVVEIDPPTVAVVAAARAPSLMGAFGDYRPAKEQRIGTGDGVEITIWEAGPGGLFSSPAVDKTTPGSRSATIPEQIVARDGSITVPFAGRVPVAGRTPAEIEAVIVQRLADKAIDPQALVTVTRNVSNTATVIGEASPGARVPLTVRGDRLLDVIATAGGIRGVTVQDLAIVLSRQGHSLHVPMQAVLDDPREDVFLQAGDVVTLVRDPQSFTAVGATGRNAVVPFETVSVTLDEALGKVGGLLDDRADPGGVFVVRYETAAVAGALAPARAVAPTLGLVPTVYHLNMRDPQSLFLARRFPMRNKDILYVSNASYTDIQKVLSLVNLLVSPAVTGATVTNAVK